MYYKEWELLLVDDEADVLSISKLAMKEFKVYGLPLKIHTAESKAAALELLRRRPDIQFGLAVAFIDVVMESDTAGLELCQYIREEMGNRLTQLFIRTGQPGVAPERAVIDRYDINGYFTKAETTEDKLYSLVKSGVRQFLWGVYSLGTITLLDNIIAVSDSREKVKQQFQGMYDRTRAGAGRENEPLTPAFAMVGDEVLFLSSWDEKTARDLVAKLNQQAGTPLGPTGDKYVTDEDNHLLIKVAAQPARAEFYWLSRTTFTPPEDIITLMKHAFVGLATVWQKAG
ncbi:MAG: response regulator receiver protein [Anaerolineae bacterium]|nr:response regulator receiver protein [Anaerolineae bacterium]